MHVIARVHSAIVTVARLIATACPPQVGWVRRASARNYTVVVVRMLGIPAKKHTSQHCMPTQLRTHMRNLHMARLHTTQCSHRTRVRSMRSLDSRLHRSSQRARLLAHRRGLCKTWKESLRSQSSCTQLIASTATRHYCHQCHTFHCTSQLPLPLLIQVPMQRQGRWESLSCIHSLHTH